jgi:hypothetical protein
MLRGAKMRQPLEDLRNKGLPRSRRGLMRKRRQRGRRKRRKRLGLHKKRHGSWLRKKLRLP